MTTGNAKRFYGFLHRMARDGDWEYTDGTPLTDDLAAFLAQCVDISKIADDMHISGTSEDVQRVWTEFWKDICTHDGALDVEQVKRELHDFYLMLDEVPKVYDHVTCGMVSKPLTCSEVVTSLADEYYEGLYNDPD